MSYQDEGNNNNNHRSISSDEIRAWFVRNCDGDKLDFATALENHAIFPQQQSSDYIEKIFGEAVANSMFTTGKKRKLGKFNSSLEPDNEFINMVKSNLEIPRGYRTPSIDQSLQLAEELNVLYAHCVPTIPKSFDNIRSLSDAAKPGATLRSTMNHTTEEKSVVVSNREPVADNEDKVKPNPFASAKDKYKQEVRHVALVLIIMVR